MSLIDEDFVSARIKKTTHLRVLAYRRKTSLPFYKIIDDAVDEYLTKRNNGGKSDVKARNDKSNKQGKEEGV